MNRFPFKRRSDHQEAIFFKGEQANKRQRENPFNEQEAAGHAEVGVRPEYLTPDWVYFETFIHGTQRKTIFVRVAWVWWQSMPGERQKSFSAR
jgi:hypothetical protein